MLVSILHNFDRLTAVMMKPLN